ncbi:MAG TPA: PilZ domain-containing protein [Vicinamibacterales bacterium]|nr:PilZ domain-containing protein [Vicinamibacterales bacterium]
MLVQHAFETERPATERRAHRRFMASELHGLRAARVKYGQDVSVIDLSEGGVLFETSGELKPDSTIVLEFAGATRTYLVPSRVLRCHDIGTYGSNPRLEGACAFRRPLPLDDLVGETLRPEPTVSRPTERATATLTGWQHVVGQYRDGRVVRGYTNDFSAARAYLHVSPTPFGDEAKFVSMIHLDALFFLPSVQTPLADDEAAFKYATSTTHGRRIAMTLPDGTEMLGTTLTYSRDGSGFFVRPLDRHASATRVFVTQSGIRNIRFL